MLWHASTPVTPSTSWSMRPVPPAPRYGEAVSRTKGRMSRSKDEVRGAALRPCPNVEQRRKHRCYAFATLHNQTTHRHGANTDQLETVGNIGVSPSCCERQESKTWLHKSEQNEYVIIQLEPITPASTIKLAMAKRSVPIWHHYSSHSNKQSCKK